MYKYFKAVAVIAMMWLGALTCYGQGPPDITYGSTQYTFPVNKAITPADPTNAGGPVPVNTDASGMHPYGVVTTYAGTKGGGPGFANGSVSSAKFSNVTDVITGAGGIIYVADQGNNLIRKIAGGTVSTYAGSTAGNKDGPKLSAQFLQPSGLALDSKGNMFVADAGNNSIREISAAGAVTTFATNLNNPLAIAIDKNDNLYIANSGGNSILKITTDGTVSTFAGSTDGSSGYDDKNGTDALFWYPTDLVIDAAGNLFVTDKKNHSIRKIDLAGNVTTMAGSPNNTSFLEASGTSAGIPDPLGITVDQTGNFYITDDELIRRINNYDTYVLGIAGSSNTGNMDGDANVASFNQPESLTRTVDGNLLVADNDNYLIREIVTTGYVIDKDLPAGLSFNPFTGEILGTPSSKTNNNSFIVTAFNAYGSSSFTINIEVTDDTEYKIITGGVSGSIETCAGTVSGNYEQFKVTGENLKNAITVTAPANFEVSLSPDNDYNNQVLISPPDINGVTVYVRASADAAAGNFTDQNIALTSQPAPPVSVPVSGLIHALPVFTIDNPTINFGQSVVLSPDIPPGTDVETYSWSPASAFTDPTVKNPLVSPAVTSTYTLTVTSTSGCVSQPVPVTVNVIDDRKVIVIPNTITPNGDGVNDTWQIPALAYYANCTVNIYNRYGVLLFHSVGYSKNWDGTYNGKALPTGTYYYIVDPKDGKTQISSGYVFILR